MNHSNEFYELSSNEKYALGNLMEGIITYVREKQYISDEIDVLSLLIETYISEHYSGFYIDDLINKLNELNETH